MKKIIEIIMPIKSFAAMLVSGFMILYMVGGFIYSTVTGEVINYSIPFVFVLQSISLSILISVLWGVFFSNAIIKKWRFFLRHIMFELSIIATLAICFFMIFAPTTAIEKLWFIVAGIMVFFSIVFSSLWELHFKKTGKDYTEALKIYKKNNL